MEIIVSTASVVIALCALIFTAWQFYLQRTHNRISVRPHLSMFTTTERHNNEAKLQVLLVNNGLGPAFINHFKVYHNGQECEPNAAVFAVLGDLKENMSVTILGDDYAMPANETRCLLSVTFPALSNENVEQVKDKINSLDIVIEYSSVYEKMKPYDSR